jgi:NAD-dependent SIR2 family protein deacetylase
MLCEGCKGFIKKSNVKVQDVMKWKLDNRALQRKLFIVMLTSWVYPIFDIPYMSLHLRTYVSTTHVEAAVSGYERDALRY